MESGRVDFVGSSVSRVIQGIRPIPQRSRRPITIIRKTVEASIRYSVNSTCAFTTKRNLESLESISSNCGRQFNRQTKKTRNSFQDELLTLSIDELSISDRDDSSFVSQNLVTSRSSQDYFFESLESEIERNDADCRWGPRSISPFMWRSEDDKHQTKFLSKDMESTPDSDDLIESSASEIIFV